MTGVNETVSFAIRQIMAESDQARWRGWINYGPLQMYIRFTSRYIIHGIQCATLDIANINIDPEFMERGIFTALLDHLEKLKPRNVLYIENIIATSEKDQLRLCGFLEKRGFIFCSNEIPCMYKFL